MNNHYRGQRWWNKGKIQMSQMWLQGGYVTMKRLRLATRLVLTLPYSWELQKWIEVNTCIRKNQEIKVMKYKHSHRFSELPHISYSMWLLPATMLANSKISEVNSFPFLLFHQSSHCSSFPPPGQKQSAIKCLVLPAALHRIFTMRNDLIHPSGKSKYVGIASYYL